MFLFDFSKQNYGSGAYFQDPDLYSTDISEISVRIPERATRISESSMSGFGTHVFLLQCHIKVHVTDSAFSRSMSCVLTCSWCWAWFTRFVPGFAHIVCAAAHPLCHIKRQLVFTSGSIVTSVAKAFSHVYMLKNK